MNRLTRFAWPAVAVAVAIIVACGSPSEPDDADKPAAPGPRSTAANLDNTIRPAADLESIKWETGKYGGQIVFSSISPPKTFNEIVAAETSSSQVLGYIYEGLTDEDPVTSEVIPNIAERWEISEDGKTYTFHIRDGVRWNDGEPLTAYDVEFTFNDLIYNDDIPAPMRDLLIIEGKRIKVTALDEKTVQFVTPTKFAPFLRLAGTAILPKHAYEKLVKDGSFKYSLGVDSPPESIIGAGPFMIEKYVPGQRVILKRNPHYWKFDDAGNRLPYLDKVVIEIVQTEDVSVMKFKQGQLDYLGLRGEDYPDLKPLEKQGDFTIYMTGVNRGSQFLFFNQNTGTDANGKPYVDPVKLKWFRNVQFRKAVAYAIDRQSMVDVLMNGLGIPQWSPVGPGSPFFHNPDVPKYPYNPRKAKEILAEAGFKDINGDGYLEDPDGNTVEFDLTTNSENTVRIRMAEMIRKDLERIGMKVHFLPQQFNMLVSKLDSSFDWEAMILGLTGGVEPHNGNNVWQSSGHTHMWFPRQEKPSTDWEARINQLFDQGAQELDPEKRREIYNEWQVIAADKLPLIYTVLSNRIQAVRNGLGNIHPTAYAGALHSIERLYWK